MQRGSKKLVSTPFADLAIDFDEPWSNISPILRTHVDGPVRMPQQYLAPHCASFGRPSSDALSNGLTTCNTDPFAYLQHDQLRCRGRGTIS